MAKPVKAGDAKLKGLTNRVFNACQLPYPKGFVNVTRMTGTLNQFCLKQCLRLHR
jgi:hypothetical protein